MISPLYLLDSNAVVYSLDGRFSLSSLPGFALIAYSAIQRVELLGFKRISRTSEALIKNHFSRATELPVDELIIEGAIYLARKFGLKPIDAILAATAIEYDLTLVSADRDFKRVEGLLLYHIVI